MAFTLIELLVVMAVVVMLMALVVPAATTMVRGTGLTQGVQTLTDQLSGARQLALSSNRPVEVRFYRYVDGDVPGGGGAGSDQGNYRALQTFKILESGQSVPVGKIVRLPQSVLIAQGPLSSILNQGNRPAKEGKETLPKISSYQYSYFRFLPDGSADLKPVSDKWFLTVHEVNPGDNLTSPPPNFGTLQIDPYNGHIRTFRP